MTFDPRLLVLPDAPPFRKLAHAEEIAGDLYRAVKAWAADQTRHITFERPDALVDVWRLARIDDPPPAIALLTGDMLANARAALDHLAFELCDGRNRPWIDQTRIQFPICRSREEFRSERTNQRFRRYARRGVVTAVERVQPYKRDSRWHDLDLGLARRYVVVKNPLVWLNDLVNIDKHRYIHLTVGGVGNYGFGTPAGMPPPRSDFAGPGPLEPGAEILRIRYPHPPPTAPGARPTISLRVFLDDPVLAQRNLPIGHIPIDGIAHLVLACVRETIHTVASNVQMAGVRRAFPITHRHQAR